MSTLPDNWRDQVVTEARTWIGTPYHHMADVKGAGVDCAMLLVRIYCDLKFAPPFDPRPYARDWMLHQTEEKYIGWLEKYCVRVPEPDAGDIILYKFGKTASHGAICVNEGLMIHAYAPSRRVELREQRVIEGKLHSYWSLK
jgi:NlpC/P60 family putative phage cell wall peptidase